MERHWGPVAVGGPIRSAASPYASATSSAGGAPSERGGSSTCGGAPQAWLRTGTRCSRAGNAAEPNVSRMARVVSQHTRQSWGLRAPPGLPPPGARGRRAAPPRHGMRYSAADYCRAQGQRLAYYDKVHAFFQRYDLLVTPALSVAAFPADMLIPPHWEQHPWDWLRWAGFSYPFNLTWLPAATCPCGFTQAGLPVGLQIAAGRFRDLPVLQAARAFEQARPWAQHRPPL